MPRRLLFFFAMATAVIAFACNDQIIDLVPKDVCYAGKQWVGGRHGDPRMFPGRDCVGCHIENDGPQFIAGGTVYPYQISNADQLKQLQSGEDCFGVEGVHVHIEGADGQAYDLTTNEAGNFYIEGDPKDLAKPFSAYIEWLPDGSTDGVLKKSPMAGIGVGGQYPSYGGCAHCHTPGQSAYPPFDQRSTTTVPKDQWVEIVTRIGEPGNLTADDFAAAVGVSLQPPQ
jgi:mono/diheme cytochrome c family protein